MFENIKKSILCGREECCGKPCTLCQYDYDVADLNRERNLLCDPEALIAEIKKHADIGHNGEPYGISFEKLKKIL